jgi:hypothetical protein
MKGNTKGSSAKGGAKAAVWGLGVLILVFGFALAGCDNGSDPGGGGNPEWDVSLTPHTRTSGDVTLRYGAWRRDGGSSTLTFYTGGGDSTLQFSGIMGADHLRTRDGNTYTSADGYGNTRTFTATVEGTTLTINNCSAESMNGTYTLQPAS